MKDNRFSIQKKEDIVLIKDNVNSKVLNPNKIDDLKRLVLLLNYYHNELVEGKKQIVETRTICHYKNKSEE